MGLGLLSLRCHTCGQNIAKFQKPLEWMLEQNVELGIILDELDLENICCRTQVISTVQQEAFDPLGDSEISSEEFEKNYDPNLTLGQNIKKSSGVLIFKQSQVPSIFLTGAKPLESLQSREIIEERPYLANLRSLYPPKNEYEPILPVISSELPRIQRNYSPITEIRPSSIGTAIEEPVSNYGSRIREISPKKRTTTRTTRKKASPKKKQQTPEKVVLSAKRGRKPLRSLLSKSQVNIEESLIPDEF